MIWENFDFPPPPQAHLLGVFENVNEVEFHEKDYDRIMSCISKEGEVIPVSICINNWFLYRVSQKKRNGSFLVHCELKVLHMFISLDRTSSAEENDT